MNQARKLALACTVLMTLFFALLFTLIFVVPGAFLYIEIGRYVGPVVGLVTVVSILILAVVIPGRALSRFGNSMTRREFSELIKRKKRKIVELTIVSLLISILVVSVLSLTFMSVVLQRNRKIDEFVAQNANENLPDYVANLATFLNNNLKSCYNRLESFFKIDEYVSSSLFGSWVMSILSVDRAEVILYQGWGACGQAAMLLQKVMHDSGYETRLAHFKGVDHEWVEVKNGTKWLIVDPWYIGNLVDIQTLRNAKPDFQKATGVEVQYYDRSAWVDASKEHGY